MQENIKYVYQRRLNEKLREELERVENIYENIENIHRAVEKALGTQKRRRNSKL